MYISPGRQIPETLSEPRKVKSWRRYWYDSAAPAPAGKSSRARQEAQVDEDIDDMLEEGNVTKDSIMDSSEDEEDDEEDEVDNIL